METIWPWTRIELAQPAWLAALAVLPLVVYYWHRGLTGFSAGRRWASLILRVALLTVLTIALCDVRLVGPTGRQWLVLAVDRSASIAESSRQAADAFVEQVRQAADGQPVVVLPFAAQPETPDGAQPNGQQPIAPGTNLAAAIDAARALVPPDYVGHIVLLSDGNATEGNALAAAGHAGVPISTVPLASRADPEVYASEVRADRQVRDGEPFFLEVVVYSSRDNRGTVELRRGSQRVDQRRVEIAQGENRVRFALSVRGAGLVRFAARLSGFQDTLMENNDAEGSVFVAARPRMLLVEREPLLGRHLTAAIQGQQIHVESRAPGELPQTVDGLDGYELVVLANVPAAALTEQAMTALGSYVRDAGGGLVVVGGDQAFTPGGYHNTRLEEILPVQSVFEAKLPRPSLAMLVILDRSGSMKGRPIELAKEATRRAIQLLDPGDQAGVIAFDDVSQWIVPIRPCSDKAAVMKAIDAIRADGRTDMYPAMERAFFALDEAFAQRKHVILLTDGISEPGDYEPLARRMAASGITISTVGVGQEVARPLLESIARIGKGHSYFCDDVAAIPKIFALETATAAKMGIVEKPFFPQVVQPDEALGGLDFGRMPSLLGYVGTRPKPGSRVVLCSASGDPLLAWWRCGLGVSVAFTSDVHPTRWAAAWLGWQGFQRFWTQLARLAMRRSELADCALHVEVRDGRANVTLDAADSRGEYLNGAEAAATILDTKQASRRVVLEQVAPGRYAASFPAPCCGTYYLETTLHYQERPLFADRRGVAVNFPDEFRVRPTRCQLLQAIADRTGGAYNPQPEALLAGSGKTVPTSTFAWPYLLMAAMVLFVLDVALRRIVWHNSAAEELP